ncbi:hypothetical protein LINGRAHAP2_LOCUS9127 [Linum grandiflorum]
MGLKEQIGSVSKESESQHSSTSNYGFLQFPSSSSSHLMDEPDSSSCSDSADDDQIFNRFDFKTWKMKEEEAEEKEMIKKVIKKGGDD